MAVGADSGSACAAPCGSALLRGGARVRVLRVQAAEAAEDCRARGQQHHHADRVPHNDRNGGPAVGAPSARLRAHSPAAAAATTAANDAATASLLV